MPLKLNVGLSQKVGLPNYSSLGASCHVEVELAGDLVFSDLEKFHRHVKNAYIACRQAVTDELARQGEPLANGRVNGSHASGPPAGRDGHDPQPKTDGGECAGKVGDASGGNVSDGRRASQPQLDYVRQLAGQIRGLGVRRLDALASRRYGKAVDDLLPAEASGLIDMLRQIKAGKLEVAAAISGTVDGAAA